MTQDEVGLASGIRNKLIGAVVLVMLLGALALAARPPVGVDPASANVTPEAVRAASAEASAGNTRAKLNAALDRVIKAKSSAPAVSVLIRRHSHDQYFRRGVANRATGVKPDRRRHFRIASVAKAFSGGVALSLVRKGKLRLNDRIGKLLPGLMPKAKRVTLRQVLHHTGGLPDYIKQDAFLRWFRAHPHDYVSPKKLISYVRDKHLRFKPGTRYEYSDTDNIVVGLMAEKVTGLPYARLIHRELNRQTAGLPGTTLPRTVWMPKPMLHGYDIDPPKKPEDVSFLLNPAGAWASGGMVSTLPDLGRFFRAYVGGKFFGKKLRRAQHRWVKGSSSPPGPGVNYVGLALFRYRSRCGTVFGHTGSFPGYRVFAAASADGKRSVAWVATVQITPEDGSPNAPRVSVLMRKSQVAAICHALR